MRTLISEFLLIVLVSLSAAFLGVVVCIVVQGLSKRRSGRPAARSQQAREPGEARTAARVGRPPRSTVRVTEPPANGDLCVKLAEEGASLRLGDLR